MPDREKVIEGLEFTLIESCWDADRAFDEQLMIEAVTDAIALLKAQEPFKPLKMEVDHVRKEPVVFSYECPVCMTGLQMHWVACPNCGTAVKWE